MRRQQAPAGRRAKSGSALWAWGLAVFALALGLRAWHLWQLQHAPFFDLLMGDALSYDTWAQRIAAGDWIGREVFYQAPLYPYFLGVIYALAGHDPTLVRVAQIALGSVSCLLLMAAGGRLFGRSAGLATGLILAVYGPALFFDALVQKAVLDVFLVSALLLAIAGLAEGVTLTWTLLAGVCLGALALTRENALLLAPVLLVWIAIRTWNASSPSVRLAPLVLLVGLAIVLGPVAARNYVLSGEWHLTTAQAGPNFYIGNHEHASGVYEPLRPGRGNAADEQRDATDLAQRALGRTLTAGEVSQYWWQRAREWIEREPGAWLRLMAKKLLLVGNAAEISDTEDLATHAEWSAALRLTATIVHFGVLAPLAFAGIWLTRGRWRTLWVLYALAAVYAASVALFYVMARYRYPLVPFLALFAGATVAELPVWWRSTTLRQRAPAFAVFIAAALIANYRLVSADGLRAVTHYNIGYEWQTRGNADAALAEYRLALTLDPTNALAHSNLGILLAARGDHAGARAAYRDAIRLDPTLAEARVNLGIDLAEAGESAEAIEVLTQALALAPDDAGAHYNLGLALASARRLDDARREFEQALALDPSNAAAHNNLGILLASQGHIAAGITQFQAAVALRPDYREAQANLQRAQAERDASAYQPQR